MNKLMTTNENGMVTFEISEDELELYREISKDAGGNYVGLKTEGLQIGQEYFQEIFVQIIRTEKLFYKWDGSSKQKNRTMTRNEAESAGYDEGADLSLKILHPEMAEDYILSLPKTSFYNYGRYVRHLLSRGTTPKAVITKISTVMKQFAQGNPVSLAVFEVAAEIPQQSEPVNVTPVDNPAPQPAPTKVQPSEQEIPSEWA